SPPTLPWRLHRRPASSRRLLPASPPMGQIVIQTEVIEDAPDHAVDELLDRPRLPVERGHRREDRGPGLRERRQILEVNHAQRRLARDQQQPPPLLEHHVRSAREERVADPVRDPRRGPHRARDDGHRLPARAPAGERRAVVARLPDREPDLLAEIAAALELPHLWRRRRDADADLHIAPHPRAIAQIPQEALRVRGAARPGDPDDDPLRAHLAPSATSATSARTIDAIPSVKSTPRTFTNPAPRRPASYSARL